MMGGTDFVGPKQLSDAPPNVRYAAWFVEKIGLPGAVIFALLFFGGKKFDELGAKIDALGARIERLAEVKR